MFESGKTIVLGKLSQARDQTIYRFRTTRRRDESLGSQGAIQRVVEEERRYILERASENRHEYIVAIDLATGQVRGGTCRNRKRVEFSDAIKAWMKEPGRRVCILHNHPASKLEPVASAAVSAGDIRALYSSPGAVEIHAFNARHETTGAMLPKWCLEPEHETQFVMLQQQVPVWASTIQDTVDTTFRITCAVGGIPRGKDLDRWNKLQARVMEYAGMAQLQGFGEDPQPQATASMYEQVHAQIKELAQQFNEQLVDARLLGKRASVEKMILVPSVLDRTWFLALSRLTPVTVFTIASGLNTMGRLARGWNPGRWLRLAGQ